ncbi:hypothetical protein ACFQPF_07945 [Fictibacillus iocasae]|uniref:Sublancin immunity protein SunI-like PH domain-containing protein n=1 Tax=Fictibacillus iocasae TaxID=2715437 RepID=A0ABW2NLT3_9BACL
MELYEIKVRKNGDNLVIAYQLLNLEIPLTEITDVVEDDTYGGEEKAAIRIGNPYDNTDRVVIQTTKETYILFTNIGGMKERILSFLAA